MSRNIIFHSKSISRQDKEDGRLRYFVSHDERDVDGLRAPPDCSGLFIRPANPTRDRVLRVYCFEFQ